MKAFYQLIDGGFRIMLKRLRKKKRSKLLAFTLTSSLLLSGLTFDIASAQSQNPSTVQQNQTTTVQTAAPYLTDAASIDKVIQAMTLEEKAKFVVGVGMPGFGGMPPFEVTGAVGGTFGIPRLGIPELRFADGPAGLRIRPTRPDKLKVIIQPLSRLQHHWHLRGIQKQWKPLVKRKEMK